MFWMHKKQMDLILDTYWTMSLSKKAVLVLYACVALLILDVRLVTVIFSMASEVTVEGNLEKIQ